MKRGVWWFVAFQAVFLTILVFGDIGFDHPGRFGLDFTGGVFVAFLYAVVFITGIVVAIRSRAWGSLLTQIVIPLAFLVHQSWPPPRFHAAQYQYLVGKTRPEVETILRHTQHVSGEATETDGRTTAFAAYRGMTVIYSKDGVVVAVEPGSE